MENISIINKVIEIEDNKGNTILAFQTNEKGELIKFLNCDVADLDEDYLFETDKELIRIQEVE